MAPDDDSFRLPLYCPLIVNGEEGKAASGRQFKRENPADVRQVATIAEQGTLEDARAAIDAARAAFDGNVDNWIYNYKLREQVLFRTAGLIRDNADRLARVVSLEVGMPMRQAVPHIAAAARYLSGPESGWVTGQVISVDGGHTLRRGPDLEAVIRLVYGDAAAESRIE